MIARVFIMSHSLDINPLSLLTSTLTHEMQGESNDRIAHLGISRLGGALLALIWALILGAVLVLVRTLDYDHRRNATPLDWFEVFFR